MKPKWLIWLFTLGLINLNISSSTAGVIGTDDDVFAVQGAGFFELKRYDDTWHSFRLESYRSLTFSCELFKEIRVSTTGINTPVRYDVECLHRYIVYWNQSLLRWDVATIVRD